MWVIFFKNEHESFLVGPFSDKERAQEYVKDYEPEYCGEVDYRLMQSPYELNKYGL